MSDLFTMLGITARALEAQRFGLDVAGQNLANLNTPGYTRRTAQLAEVPPLDPWSVGGGVTATGVSSSRAPLIDTRLRIEQPALARESAVADHLDAIDSSFGLPGASLDAALAQFYNTYGTLAENPASTTARQQVVTEGQSLASAFAAMADRLQTAQRSADAELRDVASQVNALATQLASLNTAIAGASGAAAENLKDQQSVVLASLSELAGIQTIVHDNGTVDATIGSGRALVVADHVYPIELQSQPPDGLAALVTKGAATSVDLSQELTSGRLAGLLSVRDVLVPGYMNQLDTLAYGVASDVNTLARSGYDGNGASGTDFFVQPATTSGAARLMAVSAGVAADASLVVAGATATSGDNAIARAVVALQDRPMTGSAARPSDAWGELVFRVGSDARSAAQARDSHDQVVQQLNNLRDQVSGVSIDEETATIMRFQRAYEANARFFQVTDSTLDLLMQLVRA
jgi:flagellar hook-associated protein 1 FlgK